jgi:uncharacterized protein
MAKVFAELEASKTAMLTTFRRDGQEVSSPVSIALNGDRAYFVTAIDSGKAKRLANNPAVTLAPCTVGGTLLGEAVGGEARPLDGPGRRRFLRPTGTLFWSYLLYRVRGKTMRVYEVVPAAD